MKRELVIPGVIALGLHALLLLDQPEERMQLPHPNDVLVCDLGLVPPSVPEPEPEPLIDESAPADPGKAGKPAPAPPQLPDVISSADRVDGIRIQVTRTAPSLSLERGLIVPASLGSTIGTEDGVGVGDIIALNGLDNEPRALVRVPPQYPYEARRSGRGGQVLVSFVVDREGIVRQARVVGSDAPEFEEAALRAVSRWRFEPGRKDGRTVAFRMTLPVVFSINAEI